MKDWHPIGSAPRGEPVMCRWLGLGGKVFEGECIYKKAPWPLAARWHEGWWLTNGNVPYTEPYEWRVS